MERLTEERGGVLVHAGVLAISGWQLWARVVSALVVVVLDVQVHQLGVVDAQRAAGVVDVLTVQGLVEGETQNNALGLLSTTAKPHRHPNRMHWGVCAVRPGPLNHHIPVWIAER